MNELLKLLNSTYKKLTNNKDIPIKTTILLDYQIRKTKDKNLIKLWNNSLSSFRFYTGDINAIIRYVASQIFSFNIQNVKNTIKDINKTRKFELQEFRTTPSKYLLVNINNTNVRLAFRLGTPFVYLRTIPCTLLEGTRVMFTENQNSNTEKLIQYINRFLFRLI